MVAVGLAARTIDDARDGNVFPPNSFDQFKSIETSSRVEINGPWHSSLYSSISSSHTDRYSKLDEKGKNSFKKRKKNLVFDMGGFFSFPADI